MYRWPASENVGSSVGVVGGGRSVNIVVLAKHSSLRGTFLIYHTIDGVHCVISPTLAAQNARNWEFDGTFDEGVLIL